MMRAETNCHPRIDMIAADKMGIIKRVIVAAAMLSELPLLGCPRPEPIPSGFVAAPAVCLTRNACCYYWCGQPSCACADGKAKPPPDMASPEKIEAATPSTATIPPDNEFEGSEHEDPE